jgi:hypothetical protein
MYLLPILSLILALVLYAGSRTVGKDMERMRRELEAR